MKSKPYFYDLLLTAIAPAFFMIVLAGTVRGQVFQSSTTGSTPSATSIIISHTVDTQYNRMLLVDVSLSPNSSGDLVPTDTYNGIALTQVGNHFAGEKVWKKIVFMILSCFVYLTHLNLKNL